MHAGLCSLGYCGHVRRHGVIVYRVMIPVTELIGGAVLDLYEPVHDYAQARARSCLIRHLAHAMHPHAWRPKHRSAALRAMYPHAMAPTGATLSPTWAAVQSAHGFQVFKTPSNPLCVAHRCCWMGRWSRSWSAAARAR
jgi:hypothetical protein